MHADGQIREQLYARLRRRPYTRSVPRSLPVLFFGDLFTARVATVGLNPSWQEYLSPAGIELDGAARRFETLTSLGATDRASLTDGQCDRAIETMRTYFRRDATIFRWFHPLNIILQGMGTHFQTSEAVQLDLAQEATHPTWSGLSPIEHAEMLAADLPFLEWQLATFPLRAVFCNGRTPLDAVIQRLDARKLDVGICNLTTWTVAVAEVGGRAIGVAGWNIPLTRPGGLRDEDKWNLGKLLRSRLEAAGVGLD